MRFGRFLTVTVSLLCVSRLAAGTTRTVPGSYATIQAAINASANGDTVLVGPGTYKENINFRGKNIVVASQFLITREPASVSATVIDGSTPVSPDTASCVIIASGEDSTAVLEGFTLTGGTGTRWQDKHNSNFYREAGGVLTENSSPTIRYNRIVYNTATNTNGVTSAGGAGIRCDGGFPHILNNLIAFNTGLYGSGITLNYTGADVRNNIIYRNAGGESFGGSGIWAYANFTRPKIVENNTIVGNNSALDGGGVLVWSTSMEFRNNILWENIAPTGPQIALRDGAVITVSYCDVQGGWPGTAVIDRYPEFGDSAFVLADGSPCIDAGDPDPYRHDPPNDLIPTLAQWPSKGGVRNDIGTYGGPARRYIPLNQPPLLGLLTDSVTFGYTLPGKERKASAVLLNEGVLGLRVDSARAAANIGGVITVLGTLPRTIRSLARDSVALSWNPVINGVLSDTLLVYHNSLVSPNPLRIPVKGNSNPTAILSVDGAVVDFGNVEYAVAQRDTTFVVYNVGTGMDSVYVSVDPKTVIPTTALAVSPTAFSIGAGDSQTVRFTFHPNMITKVGLGIYQPLVKVDSRFGVGTTHFEKPMKFKIINWTGILWSREFPARFGLDQNYPNPFNPISEIGFRIAEGGFVALKVYDLLGREVATLVNENKEAGAYSVRFDAGTRASGVYVYRLESVSRMSHFVETRSMVLIR